MKTGTLADTCGPSLGEAEMGESLGLPSQLSSRFSVRNLVSKNRVESS